MNIERKGWELYATNGDMGPMVHIKTPDGRGAGVCVNGEYAMLVLEMLAAAPKAPQQVSNTPQDDPLSGWLVTEISAIDCEYRGDPSYTHDAYWMREAVIGFIEKHKSVIDVTPPQQQEQSGEAVDAYNLHCETCNGHGFVMHSVRHGESDFEDFEQECPVCDGAGKAPKHVQDLQARYQEVRSELHALNMKIGMESLLGPSPTTPTATASQESAPGQEAVAWNKRKYGEDLIRDICEEDEPKEGAYAVMVDLDWLKEFIIDTIPDLYLAPPTSTAIAAMVIKQAVDKCNEPIQDEAINEMPGIAWARNYMVNKLRALTPANAEAELVKVIMKVINEAHEYTEEGVRRVLDEKGE
jgi:hypothetical protein